MSSVPVYNVFRTSIFLVATFFVNGCEPSFQVKPVSVKVTRSDQLLGAAHRHTIWINSVNVGLIRNGETITVFFIPKINEKNSIYIEGYDPFITNPTSNSEYFDIGSNGEILAEVKWNDQFKLELNVSILNQGEYPKAEVQKRSR